MPSKKSTSEKLIEVVLDVLVEKKAADIVVLNIANKSSIADYFILASGLADKHVKTLFEEVEQIVKKKLQEKVLRVEGLAESVWIVLDYGNVIVHLFTKEQRKIFRLEEYWRGRSER